MTIRVLLADDHAIVRDGLRSLLSIEQNITIVGDASDGRQAVQQVQLLKPDVVVIDISMPELNGIEATRQIIEMLPRTRCIILSMHASAEYVYRALQAGAVGYLLKESAGKEVAQAIRTVHSGGRYLGSEITKMVIDDYVIQRATSTNQSPLESLSPREREILQMVVEGKSSVDIAEVLSLSPPAQRDSPCAAALPRAEPRLGLLHWPAPWLRKPRGRILPSGIQAAAPVAAPLPFGRHGPCGPDRSAYSYPARKSAPTSPAPARPCSANPLHGEQTSANADQPDTNQHRAMCG